VLIPVLSFSLIKEGPTMRITILAWMTPRYAMLWRNISDDVSFTLSKYVRALLLLSLATLVAYGVAFSLMGVSYALVLAAVAALLEFIPVVGPLGHWLAPSPLRHLPVRTACFCYSDLLLHTASFRITCSAPT
jgi:predicted PurR-regulated permease PerM